MRSTSLTGGARLTSPRQAHPSKPGAAMTPEQKRGRALPPNSFLPGRSSRSGSTPRPLQVMDGSIALAYPGMVVAGSYAGPGKMVQPAPHRGKIPPDWAWSARCRRGRFDSDRRPVPGWHTGSAVNAIPYWGRTSGLQAVSGLVPGPDLGQVLQGWGEAAFLVGF